MAIVRTYRTNIQRNCQEFLLLIGRNWSTAVEPVIRQCQELFLHKPQRTFNFMLLLQIENHFNIAHSSSNKKEKANSFNWLMTPCIRIKNKYISIQTVQFLNIRIQNKYLEWKTTEPTIRNKNLIKGCYITWLVDN